MRHIFIRHEDVQGDQLPDGELEIRKFGPEGFGIKLQVPVDNEHAWQFLQDMQQIMHHMGDTYTAGDVERGLRMLGEAEAYLTHWRQGAKLVPAAKYAALQRELDAAIAAKRALQEDNDRAAT